MFNRFDSPKSQDQNTVKVNWKVESPTRIKMLGFFSALISNENDFGLIA